MTAFIIDTEEYTTDDVLVLAVKEDADILNGKNSGRLQNGVAYRDPIGVYYNHTLTIQRRVTCPVAKWDDLFDILSNPHINHTVTLPHNQGTITYEAYVDGPKHALEKIENGKQYWGQFDIKFVAVRPYPYS